MDAPSGAYDHGPARMDMSELNPTPSPLPAAGSEAQAHDDQHWSELLGQVGAEIAGPLTAAIERVTALAVTGKIDRHNLRALRDELDQARRAGMLGQQLARFASRRLRQNHERLQLTQMLRDVLLQRGRETQARGVQLKQVLQPVEVLADASLLFSLLNTVLDWALACARSHIEFRVELKSWPAHGRLSCRFVHRPLDELDDGAPADAPAASSLDSLTWRLLQQTALAMGLRIERHDEATTTLLALEFPRTISAQQMEGVSAVELDQGFASSTNSKPLAGSHVLVLAPRREVRSQVREAIRHMGLIIDFVGSVEEAMEFCADGLPHAIVFESALRGERFDALRGEILAEVPDFVFIELAEEGKEFEVSGFSSSGMARVGRDAIMSSLPSALLFELSRGL
jgi:hypothetical protein